LNRYSAAELVHHVESIDSRDWATRQPKAH
jgi:hypothetical protein